MSVGRRSPVPMTSSLAWLQRGCGTAGFTFAQKPYSEDCRSSHMPTGRLSTNEKRTIDFADLKPYFHGTARRNGAPCCLASGWPYAPVTKNASSFEASGIVSPSMYGQGYQAMR